jgi:site-specific DNA recombinase
LDSIKAQIAKVKQTISRLIDGYAEGLLDKDEFTLRIRRAKERLRRLEEQLQSQADLAAQRRELLLIITRFEDFTARIKDGLQHADWQTKRDLVRALVRRVEISPDGVNVVFRVDPAIPPSVPPGGIMPDCTRGELTAERHIAANEHPVCTGQSEAHTLVVAVAQTNCEAAAMHFRFEIQYAEHLHSIR